MSGSRRPKSPVRRCIKRREQHPEQAGQGGPVGGAEPVQQRLLVLDEIGQGGVHPGPAGRGQRDQHAAPVLRIRLTADQSGGGQPVHPVGHRAGGDQGGPEQCPGRELIRRSLPAQRGQHVEFPGLQAVCGERGAPGQVQVPGQPGDPAEHLERLHVQVGPLGPPGGHQVVHLVARLSGAARAIIHARSISLDIKRVSGQPGSYTLTSRKGGVVRCGTQAPTCGSAVNGRGPSSTCSPGCRRPIRAMWWTWAAARAT